MNGPWDKPPPLPRPTSPMKCRKSFEEVRFQVLKETRLKMTLVCYFAPFGLVEIDLGFRDTYYVRHFRNVDKFMSDCTVQHPKKKSSSRLEKLADRLRQHCQ
jgi:hypothetical protein